MKKKNLLIAAVACVAMAFSACQKSDDSIIDSDAAVADNTGYASGEKFSANVNQLVAQLRQATQQYHDYNVALADGFFNTEECVSIPGVGGMGVHFVNFSRLDSTFNALEPEVLVYQIMPDGSYKLGAIEYLHTGSTAPMFGGEIMFHPFPEPFATYALHVWAWKANPSGLFEDWNPNVTCP